MDERMLAVTRADGRYPYEAYEFVCDAVTYTQDSLGRSPREEDDPDADHHVSGEELARGACELAVQEFGLMAGVVFRQWNVRTTEDLGNVLFNLIRGELLAASENDSQDDFRDLFDLGRALADGFDLTLAGPRDARKGPR